MPPSQSELILKAFLTEQNIPFAHFEHCNLNKSDGNISTEEEVEEIPQIGQKGSRQSKECRDRIPVETEVHEQRWRSRLAQKQREECQRNKQETILDRPLATLKPVNRGFQAHAKTRRIQLVGRHLGHKPMITIWPVQSE